MRLSIRHLAVCRYAQAIPYEIQALRLTPRSYDGLSVLNWQVRGGRSRVLPAFVDGLGNLVHTNAINRLHDSAAIIASGVVETSPPRSPVRDANETLPPAYYLRETTLTRIDGAVQALAGEFASIGRPRDKLMRMARAVAEAITLTSDSAAEPVEAAAALTAGEGSSREAAHLLIALCRAHGIPARYVSGYLFGSDGAGHVAGHGWVEAFIDDVGWLGYDPVLGGEPGERHVRLAIGLDWWWAAPARASRRGADEESPVVTLDMAEGGQ